MGFNQDRNDLSKQANMSYVVLDQNNKPTIIRGYFELIEVLKTNKLIRKKFIPLPEIESMILEGQPFKKIRKTIKKNNQTTMKFTWAKYWELGGRLRQPPGESTLVKVLDVVTAPISASMKAARWATARNGDTILDKIEKAREGQKATKTLPGKFFLDLFINSIDIHAIENGMVIDGRLHKEPSHNQIFMTEFGGMDIALLPAIRELLQLQNLDSKLLRKEIKKMSVDIATANSRFNAVWFPVKKLKHKMDEFGKRYNEEVLNNKLEWKETDYYNESLDFMRDIYLIVNMVLTLVDTNQKKQLLRLTERGHESENDYVEGEFNLLKIIFQDPNALRNIVRSVITNPKVRRITDQPGVGQKIKEAIAYLPEFINQVIENTKS